MTRFEENGIVESITCERPAVQTRATSQHSDRVQSNTAGSTLQDI